MRIAVFYSESNLVSAHSLTQVIKSYDIRVKTVKTEDLWDRTVYKNPLHVLDNTTHLVYIFSHASKDLPSFAFFAGLAIGKEIRLIILELDENMPVPENCLHLSVVLKLSDFEEFLVSEQHRYNEQNRRDEARKKLLDQGIPCFEDSFIQVVSLGNLEASKLFLEAGFSPMIQDSHGTPLLSIATREKHQEIVKLLLDTGVNIDRQSQDRGYSALMDAAQKGDVVIGKILLEQGAKTQIKSKDGQTALIISAGRGDFEFSQLLIKYNANPNTKDSLGMSARSYAKLFKNEKMIELFNTIST